MAAPPAGAYGPPVPSPPREGRAPRPQRAPVRIGPYVVEEELARGGMGVVYRVRHETTGQPYALKSVLVDAGGPGHAEAVLRFQREAEALALVEHPHVVRVHAADLTHDPPYLVQTLLPGGSLADRLRQGPLPPRAAAALVAKVARGILHAHQRGVLHRDLKPENILFDDRGEPRIVDLGLTTGLSTPDRLTRTGELLGTPAYMAPEQARGERADARSDLYALGACLWAALVGRPPHAGGNVVAILESVLTRPAPPPSREVPAVPPALDAIVARAMAAEPDARYQDAGELAAALERVAGGDPTRSRPAGRAARPGAGSPGGLALAGGLAAALSIAGGVGAWALRDRGPEARHPADPPPPRPGRAPATEARAPQEDAALLRALDRLAARDLEAAVAPARSALAPGPRPVTADEAAAFGLLLEHAGVGADERALALEVLRVQPRGAGLAGALGELLDAAAGRSPPLGDPDALLAAAGLIEPLDAPGRASRLARLRARAAELSRGLHWDELERERSRVLRAAEALAPIARAVRRLDPRARAYDRDDPDAIFLNVAVLVGATRLQGPERTELLRSVRPLHERFPEDPALTSALCALWPERPARVEDPDWRAIVDLCQGGLARLAPLPPTENTRAVHKSLVDTLRSRAEHRDPALVLETLRREAASVHSGPFTDLRLVESLAREPAPGAADEARLALGRVLRAGEPVPEWHGTWFERYLWRVRPAWVDAVPDGHLPPRPLPLGVTFGARPGSYVVFPSGSQDELELVWIPGAGGDGFYLGRAEVSAGLLRGPSTPGPDAPARGLTWGEVDGLLRRVPRLVLRLPSAEEWAAAAASRPELAGVGPPLLRGPRGDAPPAAAGLRVALDAR